MQGVVTLSEHECATSDYTLAFIEEGPPSFLRLTLDADTAGNEGRFINDFRGVLLPPRPHAASAAYSAAAPQRQRAAANVRFAARTDGRGVLQMGVYVLPSLKDGVAKHEELLLSYGKGYWLARGLLRGTDTAAADAAAAADAQAGDAASAALAALAV
jgi:hypothetical protein